MNHGWIRSALWTAAILVLGAAAALLPGCSKKSNKVTNTPMATLELNSGDLAQNATYDHTFGASGTFVYHCERHSQMAHATVMLVDGSPTTANVTIQGFAFNPNMVHVAPNGSVHWVNLDTSPHTVTSDSPNP